MLNKQKGNMYDFVSHTWNAIKGICPHDCSYCYMKAFPQKKMRFDEQELKTDLGRGNFIFVGSSIDMFAHDMPSEWIEKVLEHCRKFDNTYLFQSKNPSRFSQLISAFFPEKTILGTTIETNRFYYISNAPSIKNRSKGISNPTLPFPKMITIEPIMDFDLEELVKLIQPAKPKWVNIGADSKHHLLNEPSYEKVMVLKSRLEGFTTVKLKSNLKRLKKNRGDERV